MNKTADPGPTQGAEPKGWGAEFDRRQFLTRSGAAFGALAFAGLLRSQAAAGDTPAQPSSEELAVIAALASTIISAAGVSGDPSQYGLLTPADVAQGFASVDPDVQPDILALLDAIDQAPSAGLFSQLSDAQRQDFVRQALAGLKVSIASESESAFESEVRADFAIFITQTLDGKVPSEAQGFGPGQLDSDPPDPPDDLTAPPEDPPPSLSPSQALAATVQAGLELVSFPLPLAAQPPPPPPSPALILSLTTTLALDDLGILDDTVESLIDQLVAQIDAVGEGPDSPLMIPSPLLPQATARLLS